MESFVCGRLVLTKCLPCHLSSEASAATAFVLESCLRVHLRLFLPTEVNALTEQSAVTLHECKSALIVHAKRV